MLFTILALRHRKPPPPHLIHFREISLNCFSLTIITTYHTTVNVLCAIKRVKHGVQNSKTTLK